MTDNAEVLTDTVDAAIIEAEPVAVQGTPQVEGQDDTQPAAEPEKADADKSEAAKRRERDRAYKERLRSEAADAQAQLQKVAAQKAKIIAAGESEAEPKAEDFADVADLIAAKAVWAARKSTRSDQLAALNEQESAAKADYDARVTAERQMTEERWQAARKDATGRYADFDQIALTSPITRPDIAALIKASDAPADLAYYLGMNHGIAARIDQMHPIEAARALGQIEARLQAPKPRTTSTAPEPINPTNGGGAVGAKDPAKMTGAEYVAWRNSGGKL